MTLAILAQAKEIAREAKELQQLPQELPPSQWIGQPVGIDAVIEASGDERDWFTLEQRLAFYLWAWKCFWWSRRQIGLGRKKLSTDWTHEQKMFVGGMGAGKTRNCAYDALDAFINGHAVFSLDGLLFGWRLHPVEFFNDIGNAPLYSFIFGDEIHSVAASVAGAYQGVVRLDQFGAGLRKMSGRFLGASAKIWNTKESILEFNTSIGQPIPVAIKGAEAGDINDPRNFVLAWAEYKEDPYMALMEARRSGKGTNFSLWGHAEGDVMLSVKPGLVRAATACYDTFDRVQTGIAFDHGTRGARNKAAEEAEGEQTPAAKVARAVKRIFRTDLDVLRATDLEGATGLQAPYISRTINTMFPGYRKGGAQNRHWIVAELREAARNRLEFMDEC